MSQESAPLVPPARDEVPVVGPRLRALFWLVLVLCVPLAANSLYLSSVTFLEWAGRRLGQQPLLQNYFYFWMVLLHVGIGLVLTGPLLAFGTVHLLGARHRTNRRAIRLGYLLFTTCVVLVVSGLILLRVENALGIGADWLRDAAYWFHVAAGPAALGLYVLHRLAGPRIRWRLGALSGGVAALGLLLMAVLHVRQPSGGEPRQLAQAAAHEEGQFFPALTHVAGGGHIPARALMMDHYCRDCHRDLHDGWFHSAHRFSSFNNPAYRFSVREARRVVNRRDGSPKASRFCAGCHDPVPLLSGAFDRRDFDDEKDPTAQAGITCTVCHSITQVGHPPRGNADYTIETPVHYPFAFSENRFLKFLNHQLVRAKPALHKRTFLKPLHQTAEFCATCHKVHLPRALTDYKDFIRGQNHYDSFLLSGVSGHGSRSFYYPPKAKTNCNECHMPPVPSEDFAAKHFPGAAQRSIHNHLFLGANTAVAHWSESDATVKAHQEFLEGCLRVDLFGVKDGATVDAPLAAPLRPRVPALQPGKTYLLEIVVRTMTLGHHFTQGTADSNQVWVDVAARSGGRVLGRSGGLDEQGRVDPWAHFINAYVLDRHGNRIDRRNAQDIFVPLYDHQMPPGAAEVVHYRFRVPDDAGESISIEARVRYRKFDLKYLGYVFGKDYRIDLPITTLARDEFVFPVAEAKLAEAGESPIPPWQRWNDYGIGLLLEGQRSGDRGEFRQAAEAFREVEKLGRYDGPLNLARVHFRLGRLDLSSQALARSQAAKPPAPAWTVAWFNGRIEQQRGRFEQAVQSFRSILHDDYAELRERRFDFSKDYLVVNELGITLFEWAKRERRQGNLRQFEQLAAEAVATFQRTLEIDSENTTAHHNLALLYDAMGNGQLARRHRLLRERYRPHEDAAGLVADAARRRDPAANHAAEGIVIYDLQRTGAPGLARLEK